MKKNKSLIVLYCAAALCFYIAVFVGFLNNSSQASVWLCLGSVWLCLGVAFRSRCKKEESKDYEE